MSGDGKISLALNGGRKGKPAPANGVKRSHAALQDGEEEEQVDGKVQTVSHFDRSAGGAIDEAKKAKKERPLVIQSQANRDWRKASQRNKRQKVPPVAMQQNGRDRDVEAKERDFKPIYGLNLAQDGEDSTTTNLNAPEQTQEVPPAPNGDASLQHKTDDELAMDALLGNTTRSDLVLPAMSEEEAFERDFRSAPDMATLDDYARVPVDQFGAALLRGMGWKEGEGIGSQRGKKVEKTKIPERRPALLGIGAKEEAAVKEEMGAWGKGAKGGRGKEVKVYNPVLLRDKRTGEMFTEDEAEKERARRERERYEVEFERKEREREKEGKRRAGGVERDRREKDRREDKGRDDEGDEEEYYRRKEEKRRRRECERDGSDEEYYRRKEKDKRRRERERGHDDPDRERSRRHDGDTERHRDRRERDKR